MKKRVKYFLGLGSVFAIAAVSIATVVSCSSGNKQNNNTESNSSTYNTKSGYKDLSQTPIKNDDNKAWTITTATQNFTKVWDALSTTEQNDALVESIKASESNFNQLFDSNNYLNAKFTYKQATVDNESYDLTYSSSFAINNIIVNSNNTINFDITLTTDVTATNLTTKEVYNDFFTNVQNADYTNVSFIPTVHQAYTSVSSDGSIISSGDYFASLQANNFDKVTVTLNGTLNDKSLSTLGNDLLSHGLGNYTLSYTYEQANNLGSANKRIIPHFIYVSNGGINYGDISA